MVLKTLIPYPLISLLVLLPVILIAGNDMSEEQMQKIMEQAQKIQACMEKIDQSALENIVIRGQAMEKEIRSLCLTGKRDIAQKKAIAYGREINSSREMKEMQKCSAIAGDMMNQIPDMQNMLKDDKNKHVCDVM